MLILAFDNGGKLPGAHSGTGLTVLSTDVGEIKLVEARQANWNEWEYRNMLEDYVARYNPDAVVYETFSPQWGKKFELDTPELNAVLKATVEPDMLYGYSPSAHKSLIKRAWAKELVLEAGYKIEQGHKVDSTSLALYHGICKLDQTILGGMQQWLKSK